MSWQAKGQGAGLYAERGDTFFTHSESRLGAVIRAGETDSDESKVSAWKQIGYALLTGKDLAKNGTWANHTGVVVESGWLVPPEGQRSTSGITLSPVNWIDDYAQGKSNWLPAGRDRLAVIVEAMWHVQRGTWWGFHAKEYAKGLRIRAFYPAPEYTEEEKLRFVAFANHGVGERYGWWKLLGFLAKRATGGRIDVPRYFFIKDRPVCSYYAAWANEEARKRGTVMTEPGRCVWPWPGFGMAPQEADPDEMMDNILTNGCQAYWRER